MMTQFKKCCTCGIWKPLTCYNKSKNHKGGYKVECKVCMRKRSKKWSKNNPEKVAANSANRRAMEMALPHTENSKEWKTVLEEFNYKCPLTNSSENVHLEHFIPVSWGFGGSLRNNIYPMNGTLNISKNASNPFEWCKTLTKEQRKIFYSVIVSKLAEENEMTIGEFKNYVYWCEQNKRTVEQVKADNEKGLTSIDLWKLSIEKSN